MASSFSLVLGSASVMRVPHLGDINTQLSGRNIRNPYVKSGRIAFVTSTAFLESLCGHSLVRCHAARTMHLQRTTLIQELFNNTGLYCVSNGGEREKSHS